MPLTINGATIKQPSRISRVEKRNVFTKRSINGTLTTQIFSYPKKTEMVLEWDIMTKVQLDDLKATVETGTYPVVITDTDATYNATSLIRLDGYKETFSGNKTEIKATIIEI